MLTSTSDWNTLALGDKETVLALAPRKTRISSGRCSRTADPVPGIVIEATASVIKLAVTQDAKDAKTADFIVNLKKPLEEKEIPTAGFEFASRLQGAGGVGWNLRHLHADSGHRHRCTEAEIVLRDGTIIAEKKKAAPAHKPTPATSLRRTSPPVQNEPPAPGSHDVHEGQPFGLPFLYWCGLAISVAADRPSVRAV